MTGGGLRRMLHASIAVRVQAGVGHPSFPRSHHRTVCDLGTHHSGNVGACEDPRALRVEQSSSDVSFLCCLVLGGTLKTPNTAD